MAAGMPRGHAGTVEQEHPHRGRDAENGGGQELQTGVVDRELGIEPDAGAHAVPGRERVEARHFEVGRRGRRRRGHRVRHRGRSGADGPSLLRRTKWGRRRLRVGFRSERRTSQCCHQSEVTTCGTAKDGSGRTR